MAETRHRQQRKRATVLPPVPGNSFDLKQRLVTWRCSHDQRVNTYERLTRS